MLRLQIHVYYHPDDGWQYMIYETHGSDKDTDSTRIKRSVGPLARLLPDVDDKDPLLFDTGTTELQDAIQAHFPGAELIIRGQNLTSQQEPRNI